MRNPSDHAAFWGAWGKVRVGLPMNEEQSRVGEYQSRAATLRRLASITRYAEVRTRLLLLAAGFERLADQVEKWENARLASAAD
jgi:hypothetical protein